MTEPQNGPGDELRPGEEPRGSNGRVVNRQARQPEGQEMKSNRMVIVLAVVVGILLALVLLSRLITPGSTETTTQTVPVEQKAYKFERKQKPSRQQLLHRIVVNLFAGHWRAARHDRGVYRYYYGNQIPMHQSDHWWSAGWRVVGRRGPSVQGCARAIKTVTINADIAGFGTSIKMFTVKMTKLWCWSHGKITRTGRTGVNSDVTNFSEFFNYSDEGVEGKYEFFYPYRGVAHGGKVASVTNRFHDCTPTPIGCAFGRDHDITVTENLHGNGTFG